MKETMSAQMPSGNEPTPRPESGVKAGVRSSDQRSTMACAISDSIGPALPLPESKMGNRRKKSSLAKSKQSEARHDHKASKAETAYH
jgi:hypothetical protein